jgi:hypothetical protein
MWLVQGQAMILQDIAAEVHELLIVRQFADRKIISMVTADVSPDCDVLPCQQCKQSERHKDEQQDLAE